MARPQRYMATDPRTAETVEPGPRGGDPARQAYMLLYLGFIVAPIVAGLDKFTNVLVNWTQYLAPIIPTTLGIAPRTMMSAVGVVEVVAGLVVAMKPSIGGWIVAAWLAGIIVNLLLVPGYFDVALRDLGLLLGALALARLGRRFEGR